MSARKARSGRKALLSYGQVHDSTLLIFPLFLAYEIGIIVFQGSNGVDFFSRLVFQLVDQNQHYYVYAQLLLAALFLSYLAIGGHWRKLSLNRFAPLILESSIYALTLGSFIVFVMDHLLGIDVLSVQAATLAVLPMGQVVVISLGAGVYEELVFRLGIMGLGGFILLRLGVRHWMAISFAAAVSALLFSLAHHLGPAGESFQWAVFVYRLLAGLVFAALFYFRSLAHAVYTHFLYDLYVLGVAS